MANTFTLTSSSTYDGRKMVLTCTQTQDITNNKSTITWKLETTGGSVNYYYTGPTTLTINGEQVYYKARTGAHEFPCAKGSTTGTLTVNHNTDGSKAIAVSLKTAIYYGSSKVKTDSKTWTLDAIPRGATITSAPNFNDEENPIIKYSNPAGSAVTSLEACISLDGSKADVAYRAISKSGTSYTFNLTDAERKVLRQGVTSGTSRTVIFYIRTKIGDNTLYNTSYKTFTLLDAEPELTYNYYDVNDTVVALTGNNKKFVPNHTILYWEMQGTAKKEATIKSYEFKIDGKAISNATSGHINNYNGKVLDFKVTDNRGNYKAAADVALNTVPYVELTCNQKVDIALVGETTAQINVDVSGNYYNGSFGAADNTLTIYYSIAEDGGAYSEWRLVDIEPKYNGNTYSLSYNITGLAYEKAYSVQTRAVDKIQTKDSNGYTAKLTPVFDWSDTDFNFNVPVSINGVEIDYIVEQGYINGWTYRKWNGGLAECWYSLRHNTAMSNQWNNLFVGSATPRINYPFVFTSRPIENVTLLSSSYACFLYAESGNKGINGQYATAQYNVARTAAVTEASDVYLNFYVLGKWKLGG